MSVQIAQSLAQKILAEILPASGDCWGNVTFDFRREGNVVEIPSLQWLAREGKPPYLTAMQLKQLPSEWPPATPEKPPTSS